MSVCVVIPAYNSAPFIAAALDSVLAQSHPVSEITVVDDGSSDSTAQIVAAYPQVKWVSQDHRGPSAARNSGIRHAQCEYIAFLDSDDIWQPDKIEKQLAALAAHPSAAFSFSTLASFFRRDAREVSNQPYMPDELLAWLGARSTESGRAFGNVYSLLLRANCVLTSSVLVRRSALLEAGLFDESLSHGEDHELWLRLARRWPAVFITDIIAKYRIHSSSISGHWKNRQGLFYRATIDTLAQHHRMFPSFEAARALAVMYNNYAMFQIKERAFGEAKQSAGKSLRVAPTPSGFRLWIEAAFPKTYSHAVGLLRGGRNP
jgi:glycosyltransferase involved in cell wall biosynthesis